MVVRRETPFESIVEVSGEGYVDLNIFEDRNETETVTFKDSYYGISKDISIDVKIDRLYNPATDEYEATGQRTTCNGLPVKEIKFENGSTIVYFDYIEEYTQSETETLLSEQVAGCCNFANLVVNWDAVYSPVHSTRMGKD